LSSAFFRELVVWIELRQRRQIRNALADLQRKIRFLNHSREVPIVAIFIRGLVIVSLVVFLKLLLAPFFRMADVVVAFLQTNRRHADFRERKMIRTIEGSLFRSWIR